MRRPQFNKHVIFILIYLVLVHNPTPLSPEVGPKLHLVLDHVPVLWYIRVWERLLLSPYCLDNCTVDSSTKVYKYLTLNRYYNYFISVILFGLSSTAISSSLTSPGNTSSSVTFLLIKLGK